MAFFLGPLGFDDTGIGWVFWLYRSFTNMAFFLSSLSFDDTSIGWVFWLYRSFTNVTFFLRSLSCYDWIWLGRWVGFFLCSNP